MKVLKLFLTGWLTVKIACNFIWRMKVKKPPSVFQMWKESKKMMYSSKGRLKCVYVSAGAPFHRVWSACQTAKGGVHWSRVLPRTAAPKQPACKCVCVCVYHRIFAGSCHPCLWYDCMFLCVLVLPAWLFVCVFSRVCLISVHSACFPLYPTAPCLSLILLRLLLPEELLICVCACVCEITVWLCSWAKWDSARPKPASNICFIPNRDIHHLKKERGGEKKKTVTVLCSFSGETFCFCTFPVPRGDQRSESATEQQPWS